MTRKPNETGDSRSLSDDLYRSIFDDFGMSVPKNELEKNLLATEMIHECLRRSQEASTASERLAIIGDATTIWQLISSAHGQLLYDAFRQRDLNNDSAPEAENARAALRMFLEMQTLNAPATHRDVVDPVALFLPRSLLNELVSALKALDFGETKSLLSKNDNRQHSDVYSWHQMRIRSVEHVAFLKARGATLKTARRRVALAMKRVSPETLRKWEGAMLREDDARLAIEMARLAGRISALEKSFVAKDRFDLQVIAKMNELSLESLEDFGTRYFKEHGHRHNSVTD